MLWCHHCLWKLLCKNRNIECLFMMTRHNRIAWLLGDVVKILKVLQIREHLLRNCSQLNATEHFDHKSASVQVKVWCRQPTSHCLSQCWPRFMSAHGFTRLQWVEWAVWWVWFYKCKAFSGYTIPSDLETQHDSVDHGLVIYNINDFSSFDIEPKYRYMRANISS